MDETLAKLYSLQQQLANLIRTLEQQQHGTEDLDTAIHEALSELPHPAPAAQLYKTVKQKLGAPTSQRIIAARLQQLGYQKTRVSTGYQLQPPA